MPLLSKSKHEKFAQGIAQGLSAVKAYAAAGYGDKSADSSASRLLRNVRIAARIKELRTQVAEAVIAKVVLDRARRIAILEDSVSRKLALREFRAAMYGHEMGEERTIRVANAEEERQRRAEGFGDPPAEVLLSMNGDAVTAEYPKALHHPGYPLGGATGLLVKDYRGKNAEQEIWKMDTGTESSIRDDLKQIAIEEGTWSEKRDQSAGYVDQPVEVTIVFVTPPERSSTVVNVPSR